MKNDKMLSAINLQLGWPSPRLFPVQQLATATSTCLSDPKLAARAFGYGPSLGNFPLRESIAKWLSDFYAPPSGPIPTDRISITGGASQNLANILKVFSDPDTTRRIRMVEPTYFLTCAIFQDAGFAGKLKGVAENENGINIDFLRDAISRFEEEDKKCGVYSPLKPSKLYEKFYRHILCLTPTFSNPSAKTMSTPVREQLLSLTRQYDILLISDDVYDLLRWPAKEPKSRLTALAPIPPTLVDLDRATSTEDSWGNNISNGSFSKIVAPGVRVGWAEASSKMTLRLSQLGATQSGGNPAHLTSIFINELLSSGAMQKHIDETLIPTYQSRYKVLMRGITTHLEPLGVSITTGAPYMTPESYGVVVPAGGFFTYITFPPELPSADAIAKRALEEYALKFTYGEMFFVKGDEGSVKRSRNGFRNGAQLCWA